MHLNEHSKQEQSSCQLLHFLSAFPPNTIQTFEPWLCKFRV